MKYIAVIFFILFGMNVQAQDLEGNWHGEVKVNEFPLEVIFKFRKLKSSWNIRLEVPQQTKRQIAVSGTEIKDKKVVLSMPDIEAEFKGKLVDTNKISGTFFQNGAKLPLVLTRKWGAEKPKPQTPQGPFAYAMETVKFPHSSGHLSLQGILSKPKDSGKRFPVCILISGSGPQDRDGSIGKHKPFAVIADHLSNMGFAVLRCDDRGVGGSIGNPDYLKQTTTMDIAGDVHEMMRFLRGRADIDTNKIFLIGHSEGGIVAPMVAAADPRVAGIVCLAGPFMGGYETNVHQNRMLMEKQKVSEKYIQTYLDFHKQVIAAIKPGMDKEGLGHVLDSLLQDWKKNKNGDKVIRSMRKQYPDETETGAFLNMYSSFLSPWWQYFLKYDPKTDVAKVQCNALVLNGSRDVQVPAGLNLEIAKKYFKQQNTSIVEMEGLNHLFQKCISCTLGEYGSLEETFNPAALEYITNWLQNQ